MDADRFEKRLTTVETIVADHIEQCEKERAETKATLDEINSFVSKLKGSWAAACVIGFLLLQVATIVVSMLFR